VKKLLSLKKCIEKGLIRKIPPSKEHAMLVLGKASEMLDDAKANLEDGRFDAAALLSYAAMLNAGRAVLFRDGYTEKSHYCTARYLEEKYLDFLGDGTIRKLDSYRQTRHEVQYSPAHHTTETEASEMAAFAKEFVAKIEAMLED
jgi:uncharacterized protein (UPF0332 family)